MFERLPILVFLLGSMLASGMQLTPAALLVALRNWRMLSIALFLNFLLAPFLAWVLVAIIPVSPGHSAGALLLGAAGGAPFLPSLLEKARGDVKTGISLMAVLTVGTILYMPLVLPLLIPGLQADAWSIARPLLLLILAPLLAGMLMLRFAQGFTQKIAPIIARIGNVALGILFIQLLVTNANALLKVFGTGAVLVAFLFVILLFITSWAICRVMPRHRAELSLATAGRNFGAAFVPAANCFQDPDASTMLIVSAIAGLVTCFAAARWLAKRALSRL
jgi:BASS family bile acid:Na+ symporter